MAHVLRLAPLAATLCLLAACSKPQNSAASLPVSMIKPRDTGNACDRRLLTVDDVEGILSEPITGTAPLKGDAQTCYFITATTESEGGPEIMISLRPGVGKITVQTWEDGRMDTPATRVLGVGDSAVWIAANKELHAEKNDLLCVAGMGGTALGGRYDDLEKKLSGLCNTVFARVGS
jgi:hypothetical protein